MWNEVIVIHREALSAIPHHATLTDKLHDIPMTVPMNILHS